MDPIPEKDSSRKIELPPVIPEPVAVPRSTPQAEARSVSVVTPDSAVDPRAVTTGGLKLTQPATTITADLLPAIKRLSSALNAEPASLPPELQYLKRKLEIGAQFAASEAILQGYVSYLDGRMSQLASGTEEAIDAVQALKKALAANEADFITAQTILDNFPKEDTEAIKRAQAEVEAKKIARDQALAQLETAILFQKESAAQLRTTEGRFAEVTAAMQNPETVAGKALGFWLRLAALAIGESSIRGALLGDLMNGVTSGRLPADSIAQIAGPDAAAAANVAGDFLASADLSQLHLSGLVNLLQTGQWRHPAEVTFQKHDKAISPVLAAAISSDELASGLNALQQLQAIMNDPGPDDLEPLIRALV